MGQPQIINGVVYDFSSIEIRLDGDVYGGITEIKYKNSLKSSKQRGTSAQARGRTRGQYDPDGSLSMYREDFEALIDAFGDGYMEVEFDIVVTRGETGRTTTVDVLGRCRIATDEDSASNNADPLVVSLDLDIMWIRKNGYDPINNMAT